MFGLSGFGLGVGWKLSEWVEWVEWAGQVG